MKNARFNRYLSMLTATAMLLICSLQSMADDSPMGFPHEACGYVLPETETLVGSTPTAEVYIDLASFSYYIWVVTRNAETNLLEYHGAHNGGGSIKLPYLPVGSRFLIGIQRSYDDNKNCDYFEIIGGGSGQLECRGVLGPNLFRCTIRGTSRKVVKSDGSTSILSGCCPIP